MAHDIFPFVNVFVVTNILTRNYHEFLYFFSLSQYIIQSMIKLKRRSDKKIINIIKIYKGIASECEIIPLILLLTNFFFS